MLSSEEAHQQRNMAEEADNKALEHLAAADGAILRALQMMSNSVYSAFAPPQDVRDLEHARRTVQFIMTAAEQTREGRSR